METETSYSSPVGYPVGSPVVWQPREVEAAWAIKRQLGHDACYVSGGTLLQMQWETNGERPVNLVSLERIPSLYGITESLCEGVFSLEIGSSCRLEALTRHPLLTEHWPLFVAAAKKIAAPAVRNRATLGGNIMSRVGDMLPSLLALDAEVLVYDAGNHFAVPMDEFIRGASVHGTRVAEAQNGTGTQDPTKAQDSTKTQDPMKAQGSTDAPVLTEHHIVTGVRLHRTAYSPSTERTAPIFRKVCRREAFAPSLVTLACHVTYQTLPTFITRARLAVSGSDFPPQRLYASEDLLRGMSPSTELWEALHHRILEEFHPPNHPFASADYRRMVAANMLTAGLSTEFSGLRERR